MPESSDSDPAGEQSGGPVARLQCAVHVRDGTCVHAVPARVYVPGHPAATQLYELRRTAAVGTYTLPYWDTCYFSNI